jgi:hypothetical protein
MQHGRNARPFICCRLRCAKMPFADEPVGYTGRQFECGWSDRRQTAAEIADQIIGLAQRLGAIDPAYGRIRPDPGPRKFHPSDLGPIVDMDPAELAALIDNRGRFDPPKAPAPVGPGGFSLLYRNEVKGIDPSFVSLSVRAGRYGPGPQENRVGLRPDTKHEVWRDPECGLEVLDALLDTWNPEWACAYALVHGRSESGEADSHARPWLAWTLKPLEPRPNPPYVRPYPAPFPLDRAGLPAEVGAWRRGELSIWP